MQDQRVVNIYQRVDGRLFLHGHDRTTMGIFIACPPFIVLTADRIAEAPELVASLLQRAPRTVPHPKAFDQLEELYSQAGCQSWKDFAKRTVSLQVQQLGSEFTITPTKKDGAGFRPLPEAEHKCDSSHLAEVLLERILGYSAR